MRKLILAFIVAFYSAQHVFAVELVIHDPIVQNLEVSVAASLSATSNYYLQGVMRAQSSSKYFGETQNLKGEWLDYVSSPEKEFITSNFYFTDVQNASWSGMIKLRFKVDDPNYQGPGLYDLKLRRFTGGSTSSAGDSNSLIINLSAPLPTASPTSPSPTPQSSPIPSPTPLISPLSSAMSTPTPSLSIVPKSLSPIPIASIDEGSIAGAVVISLDGFGVSPSPHASTINLPGDPRQVLTLNRSRLKTVLILGTGLIILTTSLYLGYRKYHSSEIIQS